MKEIFIYTNFSSWLEEKPDAVIKGTVTRNYEGYIEVRDENGLTQLINMEKLFAVVY